jgi:hypothetical protein
MVDGVGSGRGRGMMDLRFTIHDSPFTIHNSTLAARNSIPVCGDLLRSVRITLTLYSAAPHINLWVRV